MRILSATETDQNLLLLRIRQRDKQFEAGLSEAERRQLQADVEQAQSEVLVTTSTGNEIKPGK